MPLPRSIVAYTAGTDTRNQFTTPADARQVADLVDAHSQSLEGGQLLRDSQYNTNLTVSDATYTTVPVTSGGLLGDGGGWNTTYDRWVPPTDWFDDFTYVWIDMPWTVEWTGWGSGGNAQGFSQVLFEVMASSSSSTVVTTHNASSDQIYRVPTYDIPFWFSGVMTVRMTSGEAVRMRIFQSSGTSMTTVKVHWGIRIVGGND